MTCSLGDVMMMRRLMLTPRRRRMKALMTGWRKPRPVKTLAIRRQSTENLFLRQQRIRRSGASVGSGDKESKGSGDKKSRGSGDQGSKRQGDQGTSRAEE